MALTPGTRLGVYEITAQIGVGGMGEVYRATDSNLKRSVAIKVLPASVAGDADRLARFQREAEVLAALNHPNIAAIYGLERTPDFTALVMELVEGEDLSQRIARGAMPIDEALPIAKQIADALEAAHEQGIVHRDLKPANIKVRADGTVKVLDFGLAKAMEPAGSAPSISLSPTITTPAMTQAGIILGTAAYMAPEQARGKAVDKRADIWAFGVLIYEMLIGTPLFGGDTVSDTIAAVLTKEPDWKQVPAQARPLLRRCLERDPKKRLRDIGDAMALVEGEPQLGTDARRTRTRWLWAATAVVLAFAAGMVLSERLMTAPAATPVVTRFSIPFPGAGGPPLPAGLSLSRDGSRLAFGAGGQIHIRSMDQLVTRPLPAAEVGLFPSFSPDGQWVVFSTPAGIQRIPVGGGPAQVLAPQLGAGVSLPFWGSDDNVLFANVSGLFRVPSRGGKPETLLSVDAAKGETALQAPQLLPGGKAILFGVIFSQDRTQGAIFNLETRERKILDGVTGSVRYVPSGPRPTSGHLLFASGATLLAIPFDVDRLEVNGSPATVLDGVASFGSLSLFDVSNNGTLVYFPGAATSATANVLVWVDRRGAEESIAGVPPRPYSGLRLSSDSRQVALQISSGTLNADIWVYDLDRGTLERRTFSERAFNPVWAPGRLIYRDGSTPSSLLTWIPSDGSTSQPTALTALERGIVRFPTSVSPDGKVLVGSQGLGAENETFRLQLTEGSGHPPGVPEPLLERRGSKIDLQVSPDGRWVAYQSNEGGLRPEIYVAQFPGPGAKTQVSLDGGIVPRWARDGRELFFRTGTKMWAVEVETVQGFRVRGRPKALFDYSNSPPGSSYDVAPDGRFLMVKQQNPGVQGRPSELHVVVNWLEELKRLVPTK